MCACVYIHTSCAYVCMYVRVHVCTYIHHVHMYVCMYVCMCVHTYIMCICMYVRVHVYMYVCTCACVYIHHVYMYVRVHVCTHRVSLSMHFSRCVCVCERERERECVCVCVYIPSISEHESQQTSHKSNQRYLCVYVKKKISEQVSLSRQVRKAPAVPLCMCILTCM